MLGQRGRQVLRPNYRDTVGGPRPPGHMPPPAFIRWHIPAQITAVRGAEALIFHWLPLTDSTTRLTISFRQLVDGGDLDVTALARTVSFRI